MKTYHQIDHLTRFGYMEQTDGETAALTSPEDIKRQMKVAIADFQAGPIAMHFVVLGLDLFWNYLLYRAKVSTNPQEAEQHLDIEVHCHSILAELCWVEANRKDGQADKDFDEHAKVEKDRINWNWDDINLLKVWHERRRGTRIVCQKEKVAFFTLTPHLLFILTFWLNISQPCLIC